MPNNLIKIWFKYEILHNNCYKIIFEKNIWSCNQICNKNFYFNFLIIKNDLDRYIIYQNFAAYMYIIFCVQLKYNVVLFNMEIEIYVYFKYLY